MKKIVLVSSVEKRNKVEEDIWLKEKLIELGYYATIEAWDDESVKWDSFSIIVIKSTWKYEQNIEKFVKWLDSIKKYNVINDISIIMENIKKDEQIKKLNKLRISHIKTWVENNYYLSIIKILLLRKIYKNVVIKPSISAGGYHTYIYTKNDSFDRNNIRSLNELKKVIKDILKEKEQKLIIQPYISEIINGEIGMVYIGTTFQYGLEKHPKVFHERIPTKHIEYLNDKLIEFGNMVLKQMNFLNNLFTRIDIVIINNKPIIMEIEVIEPYLYIKTLDETRQNEVIDLLARQIIRRI